MRELTLAMPQRTDVTRLKVLWTKVVAGFRRAVQAVDNHFYEVEQFQRRLDRAKDENFRKFWPYYIR